MIQKVCAAACLLAALFGVHPASAQPTAHLLLPRGCYPTCSTSLMTVAPDAPAVLSHVTLPTLDARSPYATPDGRVVAWLEPGEPVVSRVPMIGLHDVATGATAKLESPGVREMLGNPARAELFLIDDNGPFALSPSGVRRFSSPPCTGRFFVAASANGRRVLMYCQGDGTPARPNATLLFDTTTGQVVATLPVWLQAALTSDGAEAYVLEYVAGQRRLQRVDLTTGAVLAASTMPVSGVNLQFDSRANRVFVLGSVLHAFMATTLEWLGSRDLAADFAQTRSASSSSLDESGSRLYVTAHGITEGNSSYTFRVFDTNTLDAVVTVPSYAAGLFVATPKPLPPVGVTAVVAAGGVTLTWTGQPSRAMTLRHVIEAGTAPGRSDIAAIEVGAQTVLNTGPVPSGTYYVRVRAGNVAGLSAASTEVVVTVP